MCHVKYLQKGTCNRPSVIVVLYNVTHRQEYGQQFTSVKIIKLCVLFFYLHKKQCALLSMQGWAGGKWTKEPVCYCAGPDPLWWKRWVPTRKHGSARDEVENGVRTLMCVCWWQFRTWDTRAYDSAIATDLISGIFDKWGLVSWSCTRTLSMQWNNCIYGVFGDARQRGICNPAVQLDGWAFESKVSVSAKYIPQILINAPPSVSDMAFVQRDK